MTATSNPKKLTIYWTKDLQTSRDGYATGVYAEAETADGPPVYINLDVTDPASVDLVMDVVRALGVEVVEMNEHLRPEGDRFRGR